MTAYSAQLKALHDAVIHQQQAACAPFIKAERAEAFPVQSRLGVYADGYRSRMAEAVRMDYPALAYYLGETRCKAVMEIYVMANPSRHWDLNHYSIRFAEFLPSVMEDEAAQAIARVESAIVQSFWAKESQPLTADMLSGIEEAAFANLRFRLRDSACLLALDYAADAYITAFRAEGNATAPVRQQNYLLVYRPEYEVQRKTLEAMEYQLLSALQQGATFHEALQQVQDTDALAAQLPHFMARWLSEGFFAATSFNQK